VAISNPLFPTFTLIVTFSGNIIRGLAIFLAYFPIFSDELLMKES